VQRPLRLGAQLATVEDAVVAFLRARVCDDGLISVGTPLPQGERVIIGDGAFAALLGIVEPARSERERVLMLLAMVRASRRLGPPAAASTERDAPNSRASS